MVFVVYCRWYCVGYVYEDEVSDGSRYRVLLILGVLWVELMLMFEIRMRLREFDLVWFFVGGNGRKFCNWGSY